MTQRNQGTTQREKSAKNVGASAVWQTMCAPGPPRRGAICKHVTLSEGGREGLARTLLSPRENGREWAAAAHFARYIAHGYGALVNWGLLRLTTCVHGMKGEEEQTKNPDWDLSFARNTRPKGERSHSQARARIRHLVITMARRWRGDSPNTVSSLGKCRTDFQSFVERPSWRLRYALSDSRPSHSIELFSPRSFQASPTNGFFSLPAIWVKQEFFSWLLSHRCSYRHHLSPFWLLSPPPSFLMALPPPPPPFAFVFSGLVAFFGGGRGEMLSLTLADQPARTIFFVPSTAPLYKCNKPPPPW